MALDAASAATTHSARFDIAIQVIGVQERKGAVEMSKSHDAHKNTQKKPLLTPKQKRDAKRAKKTK